MQDILDDIPLDLKLDAKARALKYLSIAADFERIIAPEKEPNVEHEARRLMEEVKGR